MAKDHKCYNGQVFADSSRRKMVPCPICQKERKLDSRDGVEDETTGKTISLAEKLGVNKKYVSDVYSSEHIIGKADMYYIENDSLREFNDYVDSLTSKLIMGSLPTTSLVLYLGRHARLQEFAYILLSSAYKGILTVGKILTDREIRLNKYNEGFEEHYTNDLEVVIATNGINGDGFNEIQGFMQERAYNNKPTIVLLSSRKNFIYTIGRICSLDGERLDLGSYLGVNYKRDLNMSEENIKIAKKAFMVSNSTLGTNQDLEEEFRIPNNGSKQVETEDIGELDMNNLTGNGSFGGRSY